MQQGGSIGTKTIQLVDSGAVTNFVGKYTALFVFYIGDKNYKKGSFIWVKHFDGTSDYEKKNSIERERTLLIIWYGILTYSPSRLKAPQKSNDCS